MGGELTGKILGLRTCAADMTSYGGFVWPESGRVEAPAWDGGRPVCGGKLHFLPWGEGNGALLSWEPDARWLVIAADAADVVEVTEDGGGKSGCRRCEVVYCGDRAGATAFLLANGASGKNVVGAMVSTGNGGTATAGFRGTATAGDRGTATAGYGGTATAGENGFLSILWWDGTSNKYRRKIGCVGEDGLRAGVKYRVEKGEFVEAADS